MIVFPHQLGDFQHKVGSKTKNLKLLLDAGFKVPSFVAIPAVADFSQDTVARIARDILKEFKCSNYAVRSSSLIEDGEKKSYAGQFKTVVAVTSEDLEGALWTVIQHAHNFLKGNLSQFSLLIQEFIDADVSGVCFTRNPIEGREMIFEYYKGRGERVVGGEIVPDKISCYWHQPVLKSSLPGFKEMMLKFQNIERHFGFPQDVEWCIKDGQWYFLQSRPITTKSQQEWQADLFLDKTLPRDAHFFFEKTEIAEIAPRPTTITHDLLHALYARGGVIESVYKKYGIDYHAGDFIKIVGNELYVDKERELKTLLPSYSYFNCPQLTPRLAHPKGLIRSIKNILALNKLPLSRYDFLLDEVQKKLSQPCQTSLNIKKSYTQFLADYSLIFEINLLAQKALKKLEFALMREKVSVAEVLNATSEQEFSFNDEYYCGNCLELADESVFKRRNGIQRATESGSGWFITLPEWKQKYLQPIIEYAKKFGRLREYGRYLTVKNVSQLRASLYDLAKKKLFEDQKAILFAHLAESLDESVQEEQCLKRKQAYDEKLCFTFSPILTSVPRNRSATSFGVSGGVAQGKLVTVDSPVLDRGVLYTKVLSPDLTQYFDSIVAIVSETGGLLSHLAIMARERHIPVIVNFNLASSQIILGDHVVIDADKGTVTKK